MIGRDCVRVCFLEIRSSEACLALQSKTVRTMHSRVVKCEVPRPVYKKDGEQPGTPELCSPGVTFEQGRIYEAVPDEQRLR